MDSSEIRALAKMLDRVDYYRLLHVERDAQAHEVRAAYQKMRRDFHPDRFRANDGDTRESVDQIAKRLNESYSVLRDAARRQAYDHGLEHDRMRYTPESDEEVRADSQASAGMTPSGRKFFALAREEERRGEFAKAHANVKMALTFESSNAYFKAKLEELTGKLPKPDSKNPFAIR